MYLGVVFALQRICAHVNEIKKDEILCFGSHAIFFILTFFMATTMQPLNINMHIYIYIYIYIYMFHNT